MPIDPHDHDSPPGRWDPAQRDVISADGTRLAVYDGGVAAGPRVLLSHATGFCGATWAAVIDQLEPIGWTAWDYRGHGRSSRSAIPTSWWSMASDAGAVRDATLTERAIGVGHSMGGAALLMAQLTDSRRFDALVLFEPIVFPPPFRRAPEVPLVSLALKRRAQFESYEAALENYRDKPPFSAWDPRALHGYVSGGCRPSGSGVELSCRPEFEAEVFTAAGAHAVLDRLQEIEIPVVVLAGAETDTYPTRDWPSKVADRLPNGSFGVVPGTGHFAPMDAAEAIVDVVKGFVG